MSTRHALLAITLGLACAPEIPPSTPPSLPIPEPPQVITQDPAPPRGELEGFVSTSLGRGLGRIALPEFERASVQWHRDSTEARRDYMAWSSGIYTVRLVLPGETKPEVTPECDQFPIERRAYDEWSYEFERPEHFRLGPHDACEVEGVFRDGEQAWRIAHRIIWVGYWLIRLDVEVEADATGAAPPDWAPRLWFDTLELPDSLPRTYPNPKCEAHVDDTHLPKDERDALEAELTQSVSTLPRPSDVDEPYFGRFGPPGTLELRGLGGMTESELRLLFAELEARVADRGIAVWIFNCGGLDRRPPTRSNTRTR